MGAETMLKHRALTDSRWRHLLIVVLTLCVSVVPTVPTSAQSAAPEQEIAVIVS